MRVQVLQVPGCPNAAVLMARLRQLAGDHASVGRCVVADLEEAGTVGMNGSPTLLVDGVDPFHRPGLRPSLSCRLYPADDGSLSGAPSLAQLRQVVPW